jgi:hypothetical protein
VVAVNPDRREINERFGFEGGQRIADVFEDGVAMLVGGDGDEDVIGLAQSSGKFRPRERGRNRGHAVENNRRHS